MINIIEIDMKQLDAMEQEIELLHEKIARKKQTIADRRAAKDDLHVGDIIINQWRKKIIIKFQFDRHKERGYAVIASRLKSDGITPYIGREILCGFIQKVTP